MLAGAMNGTPVLVAIATPCVAPNIVLDPTPCGSQSVKLMPIDVLLS